MKEHSLNHAEAQDKQGFSSKDEQQIKSFIHKTHPYWALRCLSPAGLHPVWATWDDNQVAICLALILVLSSRWADLQQKQMQAAWIVTIHMGTQTINSAKDCKTIISPPNPKAKGGASF